MYNNSAVQYHTSFFFIRGHSRSVICAYIHVYIIGYRYLQTRMHIWYPDNFARGWLNSCMIATVIRIRTWPWKPHVIHAYVGNMQRYYSSSDMFIIVHLYEHLIEFCFSCQIATIFIHYRQKIWNIFSYQRSFVFCGVCKVFIYLINIPTIIYYVWGVNSHSIGKWTAKVQK